MPEAFSTVCLSLSQHNDLIADWEPIDKEAAWLTPADDVSAGELEAAIAPTLQSVQWIVTSLKDERVLIEADPTRIITPAPPGRVYHVAPRQHRGRILADGLALHTGGNTRMQRKYPPRIFLALDLFAAFEFVDFQCKQNPSPHNGFRSGVFDTALMKQLDIWRVSLPTSCLLRRDVLFPGRAGWTDQAIPRRQLKLVRWWRQARGAWRFLRQYGVL